MVDAGLPLDRQLAAMTVLADKDERLVVINGEEVVSAVSVEETSDCPIYTVVVGWNPRRSVAYSERDGALACSLDASGTTDAPDATDDDRMTIVALHGNGALTAEQERQLFGGNEPDDTWQMVKAGARRVAAQLRIAVERQVDAER